MSPGECLATIQCTRGCRSFGAYGCPIQNCFQTEPNVWREAEIGRTGCELLLPPTRRRIGERRPFGPSLRLSPLAGREGAWLRPQVRGPPMAIASRLGAATVYVMDSVLIGLLSALVSTNQPVSVSDLVARTTGIAVTVPNPIDPTEKQYQKLLEIDDAAQEEVDKWIRDETVFREKGAGLPDATP